MFAKEGSAWPKLLPARASHSEFAIAVLRSERFVSFGLEPGDRAGNALDVNCRLFSASVSVFFANRHVTIKNPGGATVGAATLAPLRFVGFDTIKASAICSVPGLSFKSLICHRRYEKFEAITKGDAACVRFLACAR